mmetsp:Transcript_41365/g.110264  ORF Transcript_41365/g.110264 Transcript_41365/m.110264 type:complete len:198 (+) Transcript_41365:139-732(+)
MHVLLNFRASKHIESRRIDMLIKDLIACKGWHETHSRQLHLPRSGSCVSLSARSFPASPCTLASSSAAPTPRHFAAADSDADGGWLVKVEGLERMCQQGFPRVSSTNIDRDSDLAWHTIVDGISRASRWATRGHKQEEWRQRVNELPRKEEMLEFLKWHGNRWRVLKNKIDEVLELLHTVPEWDELVRPLILDPLLD